MLYSSHGAALIWTAVVYQLIVSSNASNDGPGYLGCFIDGRVGGRSLGGAKTTSDSLSLEWCFNYCTTRAYKYAGVEYQEECYCGNNEDYGSRGRAALSECRYYTCKGNSNQFCGSTWRIAIYQISQRVCDNTIGPPVNGSREVTNPTHVSFILKNSKFFGTRVRFKCETGYVIQGDETIECIQKGNIAEWSNSVPTCIVVPLTTIAYTAPSMSTTMNLTNTSMAMTTVSYTATNSTNVTTSSEVSSGTPDATDGPEMSDQQTSQTRTIVGITVAGVIAVLVILLVVVIIILRRRGNKRHASSDVVMVDVTPSTNQIQGDSDVTTEPNQASTIPVYSQVIRNQNKNENDPVYANPDDGVNDSVANAAYEVNLGVRPSLNEHDNGTGLVDNILYETSALKDESEMRKNDLNDGHARALTTMKGQPGWAENIIYE